MFCLHTSSSYNRQKNQGTDLDHPKPWSNHTGCWAPSNVVELVTRFARRLSQDVPWSDIETLLVLINQVLGVAHASAQACMCWTIPASGRTHYIHCVYIYKTHIHLYIHAQNKSQHNI